MTSDLAAALIVYWYMKLKFSIACIPKIVWGVRFQPMLGCIPVSLGRLCVVLKWAWREVEVPPRILLLFKGEQLELPCKSLPVLICPKVKPPILHMVGWISQIYPNAQLVEWKYCHLLHHISLSKFGQVSCRMNCQAWEPKKAYGTDGDPQVCSLEKRMAAAFVKIISTWWSDWRNNFRTLHPQNEEI